MQISTIRSEFFRLLFAATPQEISAVLAREYPKADPSAVQAISGQTNNIAIAEPQQSEHQFASWVRENCRFAQKRENNIKAWVQKNCRFASDQPPIKPLEPPPEPPVPEPKDSQNGILQQARSKAISILGSAERFLYWLDEQGFDSAPIDAIYFYGSRAYGKQGPDSDWDFLVVGQDFSDVESERLRLAEEGNMPRQFVNSFGIDTPAATRGSHSDIVFDEIISTNPLRFKIQQNVPIAIKLWPSEDGENHDLGLL
jgi:hypothetical protein